MPEELYSGFATAVRRRHSAAVGWLLSKVVSSMVLGRGATENGRAADRLTGSVVRNKCAWQREARTASSGVALARRHQEVCGCTATRASQMLRQWNAHEGFGIDFPFLLRR
jgi:hypothetical protein